MSSTPGQSDGQDPEAPQQPGGLASRLTGGWARRVVWAVILVGSAGFLAFGNLSVVSYRYSPFLQQTFREIDERGFLDIWREQIQNLPSATPQWVVNASFVLAIILVLAAVGYGAWLLLVRSEEAHLTRTRSGLRYRRADD
ncbi:MAG TPA: hypothetical protein VD789_12990 [Thermomicrobiales bacterium]|nr:hypothetical protein [Thermomicrobiales bacterium]